MNKKIFRYGSILRLGTLQFDGHVHDYFVENSQKLVEFYLLPRGEKVKNFVSFYQSGKLVEKKDLFSPKSIILAYPTFYLQYLTILFKYFKKKEKLFFINSLPVFFFFNSFWKLFRNMEIVYWVQDFWPMDDWHIKVFCWFMYFYHDEARYAIYVTDRINKVMNRGILKKGKTVMLGTDETKVGLRQLSNNHIKLCFIGVLKEFQGIELLLSAVSKKKDIMLTLIGTGERSVVDKINRLIIELKIEEQVYFPNKFFYKTDLEEEIKDCHIGVVFYDEKNNSNAYFADPAKLKQYAEFGFPIITTDTAETARYIIRFKAGEIVKGDEKSIIQAIYKIKNNYKKYLKGVNRFCRYFNYHEYYKKNFLFMEQKRIKHFC